MCDNKELMDKFSRVGMLMRRNNRRGSMEAVGDPCRGQSRVLSLLKTHPEISQKELASLLDIRSQSLGELLMKLERNGLLARTPSESDRRAMLIQLTPKGTEAAGRLEEGLKKSVEVFDCMNPEEKDRLSGYLDRLIASLEKEGRQDSESERACGHPHPFFHCRDGRCRRGYDEKGSCHRPETSGGPK